MELRLSNCLYTAPDSVADPDLQIRGRGRGRGGHSDSEIREGAGLQKLFFGPSGLILV